MKNKVLAACVSLIVAFGMWLYVITVISPGSEKTYYDIPVILQNENTLAERGFMITHIDDATVTLHLAGNRTDLNKLNESNINIFANLASIEAPGAHRVNYSVSFPGNVANNAITTQSGSPGSIKIEVERRIKKSVDVRVEYTGSVLSGFLADKENPVLDFQTIELSGPESVVSQIDHAKVQVDLTGKTQTIVGEFNYTLCNSQGEPVNAELVTTSAQAVNLAVNVLRVKELRLKLNVVAGGGATEKSCSIDINPAKIRVSGSPAILEGLDVLELGTIELGEMLKDEVLTFPIQLPEGVNNETGITEAKVDIKFPDLLIRQFDITNIKPVNVPEGMEVDMITMSLPVTVRGPKTVVEKMTENNITVVVDFSGIGEGTAKIAADIQVSVYKDVGAVGSYNVSATLKKKSP